jgi:hypothetical protein
MLGTSKSLIDLRQVTSALKRKLRDLWLMPADGVPSIDRAYACEVIRSIGLTGREAGLIVRLAPPLVLIKGEGNRVSVSEVVLAARFKDALLLSGRSWPVPVCVLVPKSADVLDRAVMDSDSFGLVAFAELDNRKPNIW